MTSISTLAVKPLSHASRKLTGGGRPPEDPSLPLPLPIPLPLPVLVLVLGC